MPDPADNSSPVPQPQSVLFAKTPATGMIVGVVCDAKPSPLALLAAGVAGLPARRALYQRRKPATPPHPPNDAVVP